MKMSSRDKSPSMNELLKALTLAQKERESTLEELRKVSETERQRADKAQACREELAIQLEETKSKLRECQLHKEQVERSFEEEKNSHERLFRKKGQDYDVLIKEFKIEYEVVQQKQKALEKTNTELSEEMTDIKNRLKSVRQSEENLKDEQKKLKGDICATKEDLNKATMSQEITEAELHMTKMQLLKENNINNRLLDELKRTKKDIDGYREEIENLKKMRDHQKNNLSQQMKVLTVAVKENGKNNLGGDLQEIRTGLLSILNENFVLNNKLNDIYKWMTKGDMEVTTVATQTSIGNSEMYSYENMDREVTNLVMRLREELVTNKNDLVDMRQQNETMRAVVREMQRERDHRTVAEEEEQRVEKLEEAVRSLKQMLNEERGDGNRSDRCVIETLDDMRKDLNRLKDHVSNSKEPDDKLGISVRPTKLVQDRRFRNF